MKGFKRGFGNRPEISGRDFKPYYAPQCLEEAVELLDQHGSNLKVIAGGTDLLVEFYDHIYEVKGWLDLQKIEEMKKIELHQDKIEIGALVTHTQLEKSERIKRYLPVLGKAAADVGSPQIRNRGTVGGNIVTASPAGDLLPALLAYDADFILYSREGERIVPASAFFTGPKKTIMRDDELLSKVIIPLPAERTYGSWIKVGKRKALIISSITLALVLEFDDDGIIKKAKACLGSVAPTPVEVSEAGEKMVGKRLRSLDFEEPGELVKKGISPINDIRGTKEYRLNTAKNIMIRALKEIEEVVKAD